MYLYDDDRDPVENDIVEYTYGSVGQTHGGGHKTGQLYVVEKYIPGAHVYTKNEDTTDNDRSNFKIVKTKDISKVLVGDSIICIDNTGSLKISNTFIYSKMSSSSNVYIDVNKPYNVSSTYKPSNGDNWGRGNFRVLCKETSIPYEYDDSRDPEVNDVVEWIGNDIDNLTKGKLYVVQAGARTLFDDDTRGSCDFTIKDRWKLVKTKPGIEAQNGDSIVCVAASNGTKSIGEIFTNIERKSRMLQYTPSCSDVCSSFRVLIQTNFIYLPEEDNLGAGYIVMAKIDLRKSADFSRTTKGKLYVVTKVIHTPTNIEIHFTNDVGSPDWLNDVSLQPVKTKPGIQAKNGDTVIRIDDCSQKGVSGIHTKITRGFLYFNRFDDGNSNNARPEDFLVVCTS